MTAWLSVRELIPPLTTPPYFVTPADLPRVRTALRDAGFKLFEADATTSVDERGLLLSLGDALGFPDYYGANWDAFDDCVGDLQRQGAGRIAVLVVGVDTLLRSDVHAFVRSVHLLLTTVAEIERAADALQFELFFVGEFAPWGE